MHSYLLEMLECPICHGHLHWSITKRNGDRIETGEAICATCNANYPIREEIGIFLTPDLPRNDLWEQTSSQLTQYLQQNPEIEHQLLNVPLETLAPADQFYRSLVLDEQGDFKNAKEARELSFKGLYTEEYLECWNRQLNYVLDKLAVFDGPIVDIASGQGYLVEKIARTLSRPVIATDFSLSVLRRNRLRLKYFGLYDHISLLAFDARHTPFKKDSIKTITTNLGLSNIQEPKELLQELRRINNKRFISISHFYSEADEPNISEARKLGIDSLVIKDKMLSYFAETGWEVKLENECTGKAMPTPQSVIFEGASIDLFPVNDTMLKWGVLIVSK